MIALVDGQWEHMRISTTTLGLDELTNFAQDVGCYGWELVAMTSADRTVGVNGLFAILKRPLEPPPDPEDRSEGWKPDPCARWDVRWWDGMVWTYDVGRRGEKKNVTGRDAPTLRPPYRYPSWKDSVAGQRAES